MRRLPWYVTYPAWFVLMAISVLVLHVTSSIFTAPDRYSGTQISYMSSAKMLDLAGANIKIAIGSAFPYTLQKDGEAPIEGKLSSIPLGWQFPEYYSTPEQSIAPGVWNVIKGDRMGVSLTSDAPMVLVVHKNWNTVFFANFYAVLATLIVTFIVGMCMYVALHPLPKRRNED